MVWNQQNISNNDRTYDIILRLEFKLDNYGLINGLVLSQYALLSRNCATQDFQKNSLTWLWRTLAPPKISRDTHRSDTASSHPAWEAVHHVRQMTNNKLSNCQHRGPGYVALYFYKYTPEPDNLLVLKIHHLIPQIHIPGYLRGHTGHTKSYFLTGHTKSHTKSYFLDIFSKKSYFSSSDRGSGRRPFLQL